MSRWRGKPSERDEGFTLVELVVAMFVLAIVLLSILAVQTRALATNAESQARQAATAYANEAMEQLRVVPWNVLKKGLASNYLAASGGDANVAGTTLKNTGTAALTLKVAPSSGDQDLANSWPPLFDSSGSNKQIKDDPSLNGTRFTVRAYTVTDPIGSADVVGLVVMVEWQKRTDGTTSRTVLTSSAFADGDGGCGSLNDSPFLASCQAQFYSASSSGNVVMSATTVDSSGLPGPLLPGSAFYNMRVSTATTNAQMSSQQVSNGDGYGTYGAVTYDDDDSATDPGDEGWSRGSQIFKLSGSNDTTAGAAPPNPADVVTASSNSSTVLSSSGSGTFRLEGRADDPRAGVLDVSTVQACSIGVGASKIPAGDPCVHSTIGVATANSGYMALFVDGAAIRLARIMNESGSSVDHAWSGRFAKIAGNGDTLCSTISGAGCVSAGANRTLGTVSVGSIVGSSWDGSAAASGLVYITGYSENAIAERGVSQKSGDLSATRSGTVALWNGIGYTSYGLSAATNRTDSTAVVNWNTAAATITAVSQVIVTEAYSTKTGTTDTTCRSEACAVTGSTGNIFVTTTYTIAPKDGSSSFVMTTAVTINGAQAAASYQEAKSAT